jgi:ABC-type sugar transport system substrate-binding protein
MKFKRNSRLLCALLAAVVLSACSSGTSSPASSGGNASSSTKLKMALVVPEIADPYWVAAEDGAKAAAAKDNVDLTITGTNTFTPSQYNAALQDEITAGVNGLLIAPGDPAASNSLIKAARKQSIAVATVIVDAQGSDRQFFIGPNALQWGQGQAQRVIAYLKANHASGTVEAAIMSCSPTALSQTLERTGFTDYVNSHNPYSSQFQVKVVAFLNSTSDPITNLAAYQSLATAYPKLKVVVGQCGLDPISAGQVAKHMHTHWIVAGDSWLSQTLGYIQAGYVTWSVNEAPYETLEKAVDLMSKALRKQAPMPSGIQAFTQTVVVKDPAQMKAIHFPAAELVDVATAKKSPDSTG